MLDNNINKFEKFCNKLAKNIAADILNALEVFTFNAVAMYEFCTNSYSFETLNQSEEGCAFLAIAQERWHELQQELLVQRLGKRSVRVANRACYVHMPQIEASGTQKGTMKTSFSTGFSSAGIAHMMRDWFVKNPLAKSAPAPLTGALAMSLINRLPADDRGRRPKIPVCEAQNFEEVGYQFVQGDALWSLDPWIQGVFDTVLPTAIDFGSYHSGLKAALVPNGYIPDLTCSVKELRDNRGAKMGADGSGLYDPDHPAFATLMEQYGAVPLQIRCVNPLTGHFFKGMLFPREGLNSQLKVSETASAIQFDWLQCKGAHKSAFKKLAKSAPGKQLVLSGIHVGIIKAKSSWGKVSMCFENLECFTNTPRTKALIASLQDDAMKKLLKKGANGIIAEAAKNDESARRLAEFLSVANQHGAGVDPLAIPFLRNLMEAALGKKMWKIAQGSGHQGRMPIVAIDDTLEPGTCVVGGFRKGTKVACWRFPAILSQAQKVLKVVRPSSHHMVKGEIVPFTIFMHTDDIVTGMQGDDDGDEVGISADPRMVELFESKLDKRVFHIEPVGEKFAAHRNSAEGKLYIQKAPMGPVGPCTIYRSCLLAVGANMAAVAMSVLIQEAIDSAKNLVRMTCPYKASDINNWYCDENGEYHIHFRDPNTGEWLTDNWAKDVAGEFDLDLAKEFKDSVLIQYGCKRIIKTPKGEKVKAGWPIGWRNQTSMFGEQEVNLSGKKTIALDNWRPSQEKGSGVTIEHRNLVHFAHDNARRLWQKHMGAFKVVADMPTKNVLPQVLRNLNVPMSAVPGTTISGYYGKDGLRKKSGLAAFAASMKKAMGGEYTGALDSQGRLAAIDAARAQLDLQLSQLTAQELYTIWCAEMTETEWYGNGKGRTYCKPGTAPAGKKTYVANKPHYAFMAITAKNSAIMKLLGMEVTEACDYMIDPTKDQNGNTRLDRMIKWVRSQPDSFKALGDLMLKSAGHAKHKSDEDGNPIHLHECKCCRERLETTLVRAIRSDKSAREQEDCKRIVSAINRMEHERYDNLVDVHEDVVEYSISQESDMDLAASDPFA